MAHPSIAVIHYGLRMTTPEPLKVIDVEKAFGVSFDRGHNVNVFCPFCEDAESSRSASCSVGDNGLFNCKSCKAKGTAIQFYSHTHNVSEQEAVRALSIDPPSTRSTARRRTRSVLRSGITNDLIDKCQRTLKRNTYFLDYLHNQRGLTDETIDTFRIGCDEHRITIPIFDSFGNPINIRRYLPNPVNNSPKIVSHAQGDGSPHLYPLPHFLPNLEAGFPVILCEGEWDALLLIQHGFNAITHTGGVDVWRPEWTALLQPSTHIVIVFDVNDKDDLGQKMAIERAIDFYEQGKRVVQIIKLPLQERGGDITDYFVGHHHFTREFEMLIENAPVFTPPQSSPPQSAPNPNTPRKTQENGSSLAPIADPESGPDPTNPTRVTLEEAADSDHFYKAIQMKCLVAGKGTAPYLVPRSLEIMVRHHGGDGEIIDLVLDDWDGRILSLLDCTQQSQKRVLAKMLNLPSNSEVMVTINDAMNVEELFLIPDVDVGHQQLQYTLRRCFCIGRGIATNQVYDFTGYTLPHPKTQQATHVLVDASPSQTAIDNFALSRSDVEDLKRTFQSDNIHEKLDHVSEEMAQRTTHIYGRNDLHTAVDLVLHSPLSFDFNKLRLRKGWLEALIIGDTRTGKGFVAEGLSRFYGAGEVVSGENVTIAGLVGGIQKLGDRFTLVWGKIPLADRRAVVVDECGSLSHSDISKLSRIRSEGIAEITKIISEKTTARTRLLWLGNPRSTAQGHPRQMADFNYGIEAASDLIGAAEDLARFDFVFTVAKNEVSSSLINSRMTLPKHKPIYTQSRCRKLLMWAWSRQPDQIKFKADAVTLTLKAAHQLGKRFASRLCLIQYEDVRFKLARIAAAAAARLFSTKDGHTLEVRREHVQFAFNFLHYIYAKPSCRYSQMADVERERSTLQDEDGVRDALLSVRDTTADLVDGLLEHRQIIARDLADYANLDIFQARSLVSEFVRLRALIKEHSYYVKKPAFRDFLQRMKAELHGDEPITNDTGDNDNGQVTPH